jgi:hypothetical protein
MPDVDFTTFTEITTPVPATYMVAYEGVDEKRILISNLQKFIQLNTGGGFAHSAGQLSYDAVSKTGLMDTGYSDVRVNIGQETHIRFFNDTGVQIDNGMVVNAAGVDATNKVVKGILADASSPQTSSSVIGLATHDVPDQTVGLATLLGEVRDFDTSAFSTGGLIYLSETAGELTATRPVVPASIVIMGTVIESHATTGIAFINASLFSRDSASRSIPINSGSSGTDWLSGFYDWSEPDANLTQASLTVAHGTAGQSRAGHVGIVPTGAGTVDTGQVGLRVVGIQDDEEGIQVAAQTGIITDDITTLTGTTGAGLGIMVETAEKFSGQVSIELYVVSGSPTTYSLDFNYGFSKYEDFQNRDVTIQSFEVLWTGRAAETGFDIALLHHQPIGWTYAATGFVAGDGDIARRSVDQALAFNVASGVSGSWKRVNINEFIDGDTLSGIIIKMDTATNNSIAGVAHITALSEELS